MNRVFAFYAVSGFVSLGYQVAWLRIYVDRFGSTDLTFVLVLCNFIGGIGAGALASRRLTAWLGRRPALAAPLRQYGALELAVSATALLTLTAAFVPPDLFGSFPYTLRAGIYEPIAAYQLAKIALATLCVFAPCFFMGVTFPLLCDAYRGDARFPARLYAWNTFGACAGVVAAEFALIPWLGHDRMFLALVAANALLGAYFWLAGARIPTAPGAEADIGLEGATAVQGERGAAAASAGVLLLCAALSGLLAGSVEADLFKRISFLGIRTSTAMSFVSFWAVLAIFLGSALVNRLPRLRLLHIQTAYALALAVYVATTQNLFAIHEWSFALLAPPQSQSVPLPLRLFFPAGMAPLWLYVGVLVFPVFALLSLLLPWACNQLQSQRHHLGLAYGANTVAFCAGTIAFTWVAPQVSIFYSLKLVVALLAIGVALLALLSERRALALWKPGLAGAALLAAIVLTPAGFDRSLMIPKTHPTQSPIRAIRSDSSYTTFVVENPAGDMLYFDNVSLSTAGPRQQTYMGLMAHFPLLAHPAPEDALLICYGVGNTAAALTTHASLRRIDVVDISRNVMLTAPEFAETNEGAHLDPRVNFIHDDGRNYLALTDRRYDLITSEPPPPLHTGVYRLYSREYYRDVLAHLSPRGLMSQWVPVQQMPQEAVDLAIRTFVEVFPHALLFSGMREELILVGSGSPIDLGLIERRFGESRRVAGHLERLGVADPVALLARLVQGDGSLRRRFSGGPVVTDAHNDLAHVFLDPSQPGLVAFDPGGVVAEFENAKLASGRLLRDVVRHLGRLQHHARGYPISSLTALRDEGGGGAALADVDWEAVHRLEQRADERIAARKPGAARRALEEALVLAAEQPKLLDRLFRIELALGAGDQALETLRRYSAIEPEDAMALYRLASLYDQRGELAQAADAYRRALERAPRLPMASLRLAWILATADDDALRDGDEALRWAEQGRDVHGVQGRPDVLATLAAAHAERSEFREAVQLQAQATRMAPDHALADYRTGLALYQKGQAYRGGPDGRRAYPWLRIAGTR